MNQSVKQPREKQKRDNEGKHRKKGTQLETVPPAEEIADDEVEIGTTGGKPGTKGEPVTDRKP
jgi:hypothetical protein